MEVWVGREWKPKLWLRGRHVFFIKKSIFDKILAVRLDGMFGQGIKLNAPLGLDFGLGLGLWRLHIIAIQVEGPWEFMAKGLDFGLWPLDASHHSHPS
jgi:hypothetical protein